MKFFYKKTKTATLLIGLFFCPYSLVLSQNKDEVVSLYIENLTAIWSDVNTKTFDSFIVDSTLLLKSEPFKIEQKNSGSSIA